MLKLPASRCSPRSPRTKTFAARAQTTKIIGLPGGEWAPLFQELALTSRMPRPYVPRRFTQDGLLGLFASDVVGRDVVLQPATFEDMCGGTAVVKPSLEVIYDTV